MGSVDSDAEMAEAGINPEAASINPDEVELHLSRDFLKLGVQSREEISEEVHGVTCLAPEETPEMLSSSLARLSEELELIRVKPAFDRSQEIANNTFPGNTGRMYINTDDFRLRFLRCELFDAKKAAERFIAYLDLLMGFWNGNEELFLRPLRLKDFSKPEMAILKAGNFQLLPYRDRSGRRVFSVIMNLAMHIDFPLTTRLIFYFMTVASESVETQRKGIVKVVYPTNTSAFTTSLPSPSERQLATKMNAAIPMRLIAFHICSPDTLFFKFLRAMVIITKHGNGKFRVRTHTGSWTEWQYALMGYGIPIDLLPVSPTGNVKTLMLQQWIRVRQMVESPHGLQNEMISSDSDDSSSMVSDSAIECPNLNDVVFRPGKSYMCHPGNVMFRSLIESKIDEHFAATRTEKAAIAWAIVREVERRGGRFLRWDNRGWWTEFEDRSEIRYKIPTYFRDFTRNKKARKLYRKLQNNTTEQNNPQR